jgi:hypothetical protein
MRFQRPSHGTVVAYLALFSALGSGAYAVSNVGSRDVTNNSLRSTDLRNRSGVTGRDVRNDTITGDDIRETTLDASGLTALVRAGGGCDPATPALTVCAEATIELQQVSDVLAFGSGGFYSEGGPARSSCRVLFDGQFAGDVTPGEAATDNTDAGAADSFMATGLSHTLSTGPHSVTLECNQVAGDARISQPSIAAIAVGAGSG